MEPDWVFAYNDLKGDIVELDNLLEQLATLYNRHLLPSFGEKDTSQLEHEIGILSLRLTELLQSVELKVRNIYKGNDARVQKEASPGDETMSRDVEGVIRRNLQKRFATPLQQLSMSFRKRQKAYLDKLKDLRQQDDGSSSSTNNITTTTSASATSATTAHANEERRERERRNESFGNVAFSETQMLAVQDAAVVTEERKRELENVSRNINDLATLVKDLASLVVDQGTVLDRVDYNIEEVKTTTFAATRELRIADRYQRKRHALCCIIILAIGCAINAIILIHKWTSKS